MNRQTTCRKSTHLCSEYMANSKGYYCSKSILSVVNSTWYSVSNHRMLRAILCTCDSPDAPLKPPTTSVWASDTGFWNCPVWTKLPEGCSEPMPERGRGSKAGPVLETPDSPDKQLTGGRAPQQPRQALTQPARSLGCCHPGCLPSLPHSQADWHVVWRLCPPFYLLSGRKSKTNPASLILPLTRPGLTQ